MSAGIIAKKYQDRLVNIPSHLQYAQSHKSMKYAELLSAIDLMSKEKAIKFTKEEFEAEFGKCGIAGLKNAFKKVKNPSFLLRVIVNETGIILFKNDPIGTK